MARNNSGLPKQGFTLNGQLGPTTGRARRAPQKTDPKISATLDASAVKASSTHIEPDLSNWMTRNECANFLRRSATMIGNYERVGKLNPRYAYRPDSRGIEHRVAVYDPKEVQKLHRPETRSQSVRDPGEIAAHSFELFNQGKSRSDVVIELRILPDHAQQLYASWEEFREEDLTITQTLRERLEKSLGQFTSAEDLAARVETLVSMLGSLQASSTSSTTNDA